MKKPKAILFDFADTILHQVGIHPEKGNKYLFSIVKNSNEVKYKDLLIHIKKVHEEFYSQRDSTHLEVPWVTFNKIIFEYFNLLFPITHSEAELAFWDITTEWSPAPEIYEMLRFIKDYNIPMGIVSNNAFSGKTIEKELKKQGLRDYFEFVISSSDYGVRKPHPYLFQIAASKIGFKPSEIWFIGDDIDCDIKGSKNAGMTPLHYIGKTGKTTLVRNEVIKNWNEMIDILKQTED
jgi:putative hydrolase of the HAD superfamily